ISVPDLAQNSQITRAFNASLTENPCSEALLGRFADGQPHRIAHRLRLDELEPRARWRAGRHEHRREPELGALLQPPFRLRRGPESAGQAEFPEGGEPLLD